MNREKINEIWSKVEWKDLNLLRESSIEELRIRFALAIQEEALKEIYKEDKMIEWKPIEKAPKDGTVILVCNFEYKGKEFDKNTFGRYVFAVEYSINGYWKIASRSGIREEIPYIPTHYAKING